MAGFLTTYGANALLNGTAMPDTLWIKGHLGDPGLLATDLPALEDRRLSFTRTTSTLGTCTNSAKRTLFNAAASEDWTHLSLWDDEFVGNPWWIVPLATPLSVGVGSTIALPVNLLVLSFLRWS